MDFSAQAFVLFEGNPHFFDSNGQGGLLSPVFKLRAGGKRADNKRFWKAMSDIYCDPDDPASEVIEKHNIVDQNQEDELRYCGALIMLRQGRPLEAVAELHGIGDGFIKDILHSECIALNEMKTKSRIFRDAFRGIYVPEDVTTVLKNSAITDKGERAFLQHHACMFYTRRGMRAYEVSGNYGEDDEAKRPLFREACRQQIEEGKSGPEAIKSQDMTNEDDKALMRLIGASEDIQEGVSVDAAARRNKVPQNQIDRLHLYKRELDDWRFDEVWDGISEDYLHALETTKTYNGPLRGVKRKRDPGQEDGMPPAKMRSGPGIKRLNDLRASPPFDHVLNEKDELVPEVRFPHRGIKRGRESPSLQRSSSMEREASERLVGLTKAHDIPPPSRPRLEERSRSPGVVVLD